MHINLVQSVFLFNALSTGFLGFVLNIAEPYLPVSVRRIYRYGKYGINDKSSIVAVGEVPKRWFKHFYAFAAPSSSFVLLLVLYRYFFNGTVPEIVYQSLDILFGAERKAQGSPEHTLLATVLLTIQCCKRFYETHYVSIFSNGKMNISHYIVGFVHYVGTISCMIGESQGFVRGSKADVNWGRLSYSNYLCAIVFLWASYKQLMTNFILVNLRKNKDGAVVTMQHKVPKGGLFEYISSPLQLTEILIYFMLTLILWETTTYHYVFVWVLVNQVETALLNHWWYLKTFKDYPQKRKALIPYIL